MTVKAILAAKGSDVVTIDPNSNVGAAAKILADRRIGALVVTGPDKRVVGIISERDVVRAFAERGASASNAPLTEVMTRKVVTCAPADTISSLMERMTTGKFRHLPVVTAQGKILGVFSVRDTLPRELSAAMSMAEFNEQVNDALG